MIVPITCKSLSITPQDWEYLVDDDIRINSLINLSSFRGELEPVFTKYSKTEYSFLRIQTVYVENSYFRINRIIIDDPANPMADVCWDLLTPDTMKNSYRLREVYNRGPETLIYRPRLIISFNGNGMIRPEKLITIDAYFPED